MRYSRDSWLIGAADVVDDLRVPSIGADLRNPSCRRAPRRRLHRAKCGGRRRFFGRSRRCSRRARSTGAPVLRALINSACPRRSRRLRPGFLLRAGNRRQVGDLRGEKSCSGGGAMQSTASASNIVIRISPSPDWLERIESLAGPSPPLRWERSCCGCVGVTRSWHCLWAERRIFTARRCCLSRQMALGLVPCSAATFPEKPTG